MLSKDDLVLIGTLLLENRTSREIRQAFKIGNGKLTRFRMILDEHSLTAEDLKEVDEKWLQSQLYDGRGSYDASRPLPDFEKLYRKLHVRRMHDTLKLEWLSYKTDYPDGYQYSQFCHYYRCWEKEAHPDASATAPIRRSPGEFMYIDWVGDTPPLVRDPSNPEKRCKVHILVTTLGLSSKTFAVAQPDEKSERFVDGVVRALEFYGARPRYFRPDNMKTAVTSNTPEGLVLSSAMKDVQNHYNIPVLPTRPIAPKDKATVERAVQIIEKEFLAKNSEVVFETFGDLNQSLMIVLDQLNSRPKKPENKSRNELFNTIDLPAMRSLDCEPFQVKKMVRRKVERNCHVKYGDFYYSVPFRYIGENVILKISDHDIIVYDQGNKEIAEHNLVSEDGNRYITDPEHLPSQHRAYAEISRKNADDYLKSAEEIGPNTRMVVDSLLKRSRYPEQEFRTVSGLIHFCDGKPRGLVEEAADYCLKYARISLKSFKETFSRLEKKSAEKTDKGSLPEHSNVRGEGYYR